MPTTTPRWAPLLALTFAACSATSPLARPPETLAGLPLQRKVDGTAAMTAIVGLHRSGDLDLDSAWIARYGVDAPAALLYVGIARDNDAAAELVADMRNGIQETASPFRYIGARRVEGRTVQLLNGQGQLHYVFTDGPRAVWLSADSAVARAALAQVLGLAPADGALDEVAPAIAVVRPEPEPLYGLGPLARRLIEADVLDRERLEASLARSGHPLTDPQQRVLDGQNVALALNEENSAFLLNTLWAVGLANRNRILTAGPMNARSQGRIDRFASTGGWRLGNRPVPELYASMDLLPLAGEKQARVERVARNVYRPCCDNATFFPDCNHGMAMLALLMLRSAQGADDAALFTAARQASAIWFPAQSAHVDSFLATHANPGLAAAVGPEVFSASGHRQLMAGLAAEGGTDSDGAPAC